MSGKYLVYTDTLYSCEGEYPWSWNMRTTHWNPAKPNELQRITGWMNGTQYSVNDTFWLNIIMDKRSNNMWKENAFVFKWPTALCSVIRKQIPEFYHVVFKRPRNDNTPCSLSPQAYVLDNEPIAWLFPNVPIMPYGMYRFRLSGGLPTVRSPVVCLIVECHVVPKLQGMP